LLICWSTRASFHWWWSRWDSNH